MGKELSRLTEELAMKRWTLSMLFVALAVLFAGPAAAQVTASSAPEDTLQELRFGDHITFERAVLDFGTQEVSADFAPVHPWARSDGNTVVRISLPTIDSTLTTDGEGLGKGISRYYVTRAETGDHLVVDLYLTDEAGPVDVFYLNYPARVVLDVPVYPELENPYPEAAFGERVVVTQPREGYVVGPDLFTVTGYGRPFEAHGSWRIKDAEGEVVSEGSYRASDWLDAWGRFSFAVDYPASMSGQEGALEVGEHSARDGDFEGVSVPLTFR
jgi:hypothetical protein